MPTGMFVSSLMGSGDEGGSGGWVESARAARVMWSSDPVSFWSIAAVPLVAVMLLAQRRGLCATRALECAAARCM